MCRIVFGIALRLSLQLIHDIGLNLLKAQFLLLTFKNLTAGLFLCAFEMKAEDRVLSITSLFVWLVFSTKSQFNSFRCALLPRFSLLEILVGNILNV